MAQVHLHQSQKEELEQEKAKAKAKVALMKAKPSYPDINQLTELLVTSLKPELSKLLVSHDFASCLQTKLKELPSKITGLSGNIKELKKHVRDLEIEPHELPAEFLNMPSQVSLVQEKLKILDSLPSLLCKVTDTLNRFATMVKNASGDTSMNVSSVGKASASPAEGEKNTKDADINLKDDLVDLLGKNVMTQYYTKKLLFDKYYDKMLKRKKIPKITKCEVLIKKGPITLKIYRDDGSDEVISNLKVSDLHSGEWKEVIHACLNKSEKEWKTIYDMKVYKAGKRLLYVKRNKAISLGNVTSKFGIEVHQLPFEGLYLENKFKGDNTLIVIQLPCYSTSKIPACCDDDDDCNSAITPNEPVDSLSMGDEHLDTVPATKSDEFIKSCVENLVPNSSESEVENGCDVSACFTTFSNVLFDADYEFDSVNDQSLSDEDFLEKIFSNPLFEEEIIPMKIDQHHFNAESELIDILVNHDSSIILFSLKINSLLDEFAGELTLLKSIPPGIDETDCHPENEIHLTKRLLYDNSSPRPPKEFVSENSNADIESFSPSPIPFKDSDSFMEEIDLSCTSDDPILSGIDDDDYDSERDILIRKELLDNYSLSLPVIESYHFDIPSFSNPPAKPPDGNTGILNIKMMGDNSE
uniref:Reverse transcriptase domain-containing protein n=1 Tax=Tanacetum cinerariifolium TaxID=118510 RepID=A0A6L2KLP0_TANCI|nr:hypothetical protein [Tanacetum cinerariifolium]